MNSVGLRKKKIALEFFKTQRLFSEKTRENWNERELLHTFLYIQTKKFSSFMGAKWRKIQSKLRF